MSVDNVLTNKGKATTFAELEEYHKLGTPAELKEFMNRQTDLVNKIADSYSQIKRRFEEVNEILTDFQAIVFIIIKDKLISDGKITDNMSDFEIMSLIKKDFDDNYINIETTDMRKMMVDYIKKEYNKEE